jgi:hypothetical protein
MPDQEQRFYELISQVEPLSDEQLHELRQCLNQSTFAMVRPHVLGKAQLRTSVDLIDAIRRFDKASGLMVERGNRINTWVLIFAIVASVLGAAACWIAWLSYRLALAQGG